VRAQTFIKVVNYQHMMPTRYQLDVELKGVVSNESLENKTKKKDATAVRPLSLATV
jgi:large subunit ribosomal protein L27e